MGTKDLLRDRSQISLYLKPRSRTQCFKGNLKECCRFPPIKNEPT